MDEILEKFENTLTSTRTENDQSSFKNLYKNRGKYGNQEERRTEILRQQKSNREKKLDDSRGIVSLIKNAQERFRKTCRTRYQPTIYVPGFTSSSFFCYDNVLMQSEWMVEKPEDFDTNWFVAPCPKGTRTLVVACNGTTRFYTKYGHLTFTTTTQLPGGNGNGKWKNCSVLDGFYCNDINTLYVLDLLSWNNQLMTDGEMEFRRYWLETTFQENPELGVISKLNKVCLKLLPMLPCDPVSLQNFMMTYPPLKSGKLDGLLFYHRRGHYVPGETPLVGWLYPYMVPEVLCPGMAIHESYAAEKPEDYVDQATFIQHFEEQCALKKFSCNKGKQKLESKSETNMEAEDGPDKQEDIGEDGITNQKINENIASQGEDTASMDAENTENEVIKVENTENEVNDMEIKNVDVLQRTQVPIQHNSLFSDQDPTRQQGQITK